MRVAPFIIGPTAAGKSDLGVELALRLPGEVVSADSMQVYRGLDIGTGKLTQTERRAVPHHLLDILDPAESFSVDSWLRLANDACENIRARALTPVLVGGSLLYVKSFLEGLFEGPPADKTLRERLRAMDATARRTELERVDPKAASRIHFNDERRTIRALEVFHTTGVPISEHQQQWDAQPVRTDVALVILDWPTEAINKRINARVRAMIDGGLVEEARRLAPTLGPQAREALGYKQLLSAFDAGGALEDAVEQIKIETRRFAKNQRTWLRRLSTTPRALRIDAGTTPLERWADLVLAHLEGLESQSNT
ncbi:MAG: tRNA (adenosine(37)-N6)-dimethylallyltransferase MiaA [Phycisphaerales bacterium]